MSLSPLNPSVTRSSGEAGGSLPFPPGESSASLVGAAIPKRDAHPQLLAGGTPRAGESRPVARESRANQSNLAAAQRVARLGSWELDFTRLDDIDQNPLQWSDEVFRIFGFEPGEIEVTNENFFRAVHPEDRARVRESVAESIRTHKPYDLVHRIVLPDGRMRTVHERSEILFDEKSGNPVKMTGTVQDITEQRQIEDDLRESEERYRTLVEGSPDAVMVHTDGRVVYLNPAGLRLFGAMRLDQVLGRPVRDFVHPDFRDLAELRIRETNTTGQNSRMAERMLRLDGQTVEVEAISIRFTHQGRPSIQTVIRDLTERATTEEALRQTEEQFRVLVEQAADAIFVTDPQGRFVSVNQSACTSLGYSREELLQMSFHDVDENHPPSRVVELFEPIVPGKPLNLESLHRRKDGSTFPVEIRVGIFQFDGRTFYLALARDVTERKRAEQALLESEERFRHLAERTNQVFWFMEMEPERILYVSPAFESTWGISTTELYGNPRLWENAIHPDDQQGVHDIFQQWLQGAIPVFETEYRIVRPDGAVRWIHDRGVVIRWNEGRPHRLSGVAEDITDRRRAAQQREAFASLGLRLGQVTSAAEAGRVIVQIADELFGWDACTFELYDPERDICHPVILVDTVNGVRMDDSQTVEDHPPSTRMQQVLRQGSQLILRADSEMNETDLFRMGNTSRLSASLMLAPIRDGGKNIGLLSVQSYKPRAYAKPDLEIFQALADHCGGSLERVRGREQSLKNESLLRNVLETLPVGVWILDAEGRIISGNPESQRIWGGAKYVGMDRFGEYKSWWLDTKKPVGRDESPPARAITLGESSLNNEFEIEAFDGVRRIIQSSAVPIRDAAHKIIGAIVVNVDITAQKRLEEQLRHSQKMDSVGQLAGGVAHDFNNILTVIQGHASLLQIRQSVPDDARNSINEIAEAAERAANLTRQLLTFSRRQVMKTRHLDVNEVVTDMTRMLQRLLGEHISVQLNFDAQAVFILADQSMIEQVLMNLAVNARDAMPKGGRLALSTSLVSLDEHHATGNADARPGRFVCLRVADTGCGVAPEHLPRLFEPFFTTKEVGKGTGLGLATVYGIVKQHHGWINVRSRVGDGTEFQIYLPLSDTEPPGTGSMTNVGAVRGGSETILVVEDEVALRTLAQNYLERLGYRVYSAENGPSALAIWVDHMSEIQLVLTDMVMPGGMTGRELAARLTLEKPEIVIIYNTGYSPEAFDQELLLQEGFNFLQKPYHPQKLAQLIRNCLDRKG